MNAKIEELLSTLKKKEDEKEKEYRSLGTCNCWAVAAVAGIAFAVYRLFTPDYLRTSKKILMMISMTILRMTKKSKCIIIMYDTAPADNRGCLLSTARVSRK